MVSDRIIFTSLLADLASECKLSRYNAEAPEETDIDRLVDAIYSKIGRYPKNYLPKSAEGISRFIRKIKGRAPIDLSNETNKHRAFALAYYLIKYPNHVLEKDREDFFNAKRFPGFWDEYKEEYLSRNTQELVVSKSNDQKDGVKKNAEKLIVDTENSFAGLRIIDSNYWKKKESAPRIDDKFEKFIERGKTEFVPELISFMPLFPEAILDKQFHLNSSKSDQTETFKSLIVDGTGNTFITFSSTKPLEGKTTFLWHIAKHLSSSLNCIWIDNLNAAEESLTEIIVDEKAVLLILDSQLNLLDESNEILKLFIEKAEMKWRNRRLIVIIGDSQFNLSKYDTEVMTATQNFTELFLIEDFLLTTEENLFVYEAIKEYYKLEDPEPHISKFNFTSEGNIKQLSLAGRIRNLLDNEKIQPTEWRLWKEDETVKSLGLTDVYIIAAILECYSIKLPIDYHSEKYFKTSRLSALGKLNLQSRNNEYDQIIQISTGLDYPYTYVSLKNPSIACEYVHMNPNAKIVAEDFVLDLLKTITDLQAEDSHAYVFRKFFSHAKRKDKTSILAETLKTIDPESCLDNLISSPKLSPSERQKCQTHKARLLFYKKLYPEALRALVGITDDVANLFRADIYAAQHDYKNCLFSLNLITPTELFDSGKCHCYLNDELALEGIQYYLNRLKSSSGAKYHYKCLTHINLWHLHKKKFNEAIDVLDTTIDVVFKKSFYESIVQELYTHKANVYIQWGEFDLLTKSNVRKSDFVDLAFYSINNAKNIGPLNIDGRTIGFNGDYKTAFRLAKSISSDFPYHFAMNILLSKLYIQKHNDPITAEKDDLQNALKYVQINLNVFNRRFVHPIKQISSFIVRANVFSAAGSDDRALNFLKKFKKDHKIDFSVNVPFTKPLLNHIKALSYKVKNRNSHNPI